MVDGGSVSRRAIIKLMEQATRGLVMKGRRLPCVVAIGEGHFGPGLMIATGGRRVAMRKEMRSSGTESGRQRVVMSASVERATSIEMSFAIRRRDGLWLLCIDGLE